LRNFADGDAQDHFLVMEDNNGDDMFVFDSGGVAKFTTRLEIPQIGIAADNDILTFTANTITANVTTLTLDDASDIGIDSDTDLIELAANTVVLNATTLTLDAASDIGIDGDTDLIELAANIIVLNATTLTLDDASDIGIDSDTNLIEMAPGALTVNGTLRSTGIMAVATSVAANILLNASLVTTDPATYQIGANFVRTLSLTAPNANDIYGGLFGVSASANAHNYTGTLRGGHFEVLNSNTATVTNLVGGSFLAYNVGAGTITNSYAGKFRTQNLNAGGLISNSYGAYYSLDINGGTLTNTYGYYVGDVTLGTQTNTPYSFYASDANARNYFAGATGHGTGTAFPDTDTTPSVSDGHFFMCSAQTAPIAITMLDDGFAGQTVTITAVDGDTDMTDGGNLKLAGNWTGDADDTITLWFNGTNWYEISRSAN
jgi:hypothetical protein